MTDEEKFVKEIIEYIFTYPDDDYMTMECLCRKLVKYDLIDKKDGYYLVADGIKADRKTEPQTDTDWKDQMWAEAIVTEPQTEDACKGCVNKTDCPWK